jgi:hypothetical protein
MLRVLPAAGGLLQREIIRKSRDFILEILFFRKRRTKNAPSPSSCGTPCQAQRIRAALACKQTSRISRGENGVCRNWISIVHKLDIDSGDRPIT